jgi:hypothetical protein
MPPYPTAPARRAASPHLQLEVRVRTSVRLVAAGALATVLLGVLREIFVGLFGQETALRDLRQISLNAEQNLASWYSSTLMLLGAAVCVVLGRIERDAAGGRASHLWYLLAPLLLACSADETVSFHEVLTRFLPGVSASSSFLHFAWVAAVVPALVPVGLYASWLLRSLPRRTALGLVASAGVFLTGAVGLEMLDGAVLERLGEGSLAYRVGFVLEDTLEMAGLVLFLSVALRHAAATTREGIGLRLRPD